MNDKKEGKGWNAGKAPGTKPTMGQQFPLEKKGQKGKITGSGKKGK